MFLNSSRQQACTCMGCQVLLQVLAQVPFQVVMQQEVGRGRTPPGPSSWPGGDGQQEAAGRGGREGVQQLLKQHQEMPEGLFNPS
ncbi:hypothetical protein CLOP_g11102 [Closterium sp. NIES-67]|nr:hypothetical protein CLOP_g11102 [Closterium sp. NIES-67]